MSISRISPEMLAERLLRAIVVHAFENDAQAEEILMAEHKSVTNMLQRYIEPKPIPRVAQALKGVTPPETVTFSGLDHTANFDEVLAVSNEYPQVEWAVLVRPIRTGVSRYPTADWITATAGWCKINGVRLAAHLCGEFARNALDDPEQIERYLPLHIGSIGRVQINAWLPGADTRKLHAWGLRNNVSVIVQWAGDDFPDDRNVLWLADQPQREGRVRIRWPEPIGERLLGFAGGISSDNVVDVVRTLGAIPNRYWIDLESSLFDGDTFLASRARAVCERVFGPSPLAVDRLREGLIRVAREIEPTRKYAEDSGLSAEFGGSAVHVKLNLIESYIAQALGVNALEDVLREAEVSKLSHVVGDDVHYIPEGAGVEEVAEKIGETRSP